MGIKNTRKKILEIEKNLLKIQAENPVRIEMNNII